MSVAARIPEPEPLIVWVDRDRDGITFGVDPLTREKLRAALPKMAHLWPLVYIARETMDDFETLEPSLLAKVIDLLTGLDAEQARQLGGVLFIDAYETRLASWPPDPTGAAENRRRATRSRASAGSRSRSSRPGSGPG